MGLGEFGAVQSPLHVNALERKAEDQGSCFDLSACHLLKQPRAALATCGFSPRLLSVTSDHLGQLRDSALAHLRAINSTDHQKFQTRYIYCIPLSRFHISVKRFNIGWEARYIVDIWTTSPFPSSLPERFRILDPESQIKKFRGILFLTPGAPFSHFLRWSGNLASQNFTTLDSPTRLHYLTRLHSVSSRAFSDLRLGEASFKINLEQLLLKRNPIFVCTFPDIHIVGMSIWNPMKPISTLALSWSSSFQINFEEVWGDTRGTEMNKWANQWNNFVPSRPGSNLEAACWVIDWRVVPTHRQHLPRPN